LCIKLVIETSLRYDARSEKYPTRHKCFRLYFVNIGFKLLAIAALNFVVSTVLRCLRAAETENVLNLYVIPTFTKSLRSVCFEEPPIQLIIPVLNDNVTHFLSTTKDNFTKIQRFSRNAAIVRE
jgi:hypothetical protein